METKHKTIVSIVQYVCDNCKMAALIYLRPHVDGFKPKKVYGCPRCSASIVTEKEYPHYIYDKDQSKVDPLTDLEIVELRGILERDHLAVKALVEGFPAEVTPQGMPDGMSLIAHRVEIQEAINDGRPFSTEKPKTQDIAALIHQAATNAKKKVKKSK